MSGGRPPKYGPSELSALLKVIAQLGSFSRACANLGFNYKALCSRRLRNPDFAAQVHTALAKFHQRKHDTPCP